MDKLTIISGALFLAADIFAVVSLAMPDWIVSDIGGESVTNIGHYLVNITLQLFGFICVNVIYCLSLFSFLTFNSF